MKCLVFGAGGYIGRHLVAALRADGHDVHVHSLRHAADAPLPVDTVDWAVDRVFVMAGLTGTAASFEHGAEYVRVNEVALLGILEAIRRSGHAPRVVFPSSRLVYRGSEQPLAETAVLEAKTVYAANKIACEQVLQAYASAFGIPYTVFRIGVPYGNSQGAEYSFGTVGNFIRQAIDSGRIRLYGDGSLRRTFTHVDDVCRAMVLGAGRDDFGNEVFNLPGEDLSLLQAAELVAARLGARIEFTPWPAFDRRIESGSTVFDGAKLLARLPQAVARRMAEWAAGVVPPPST